MTQTIQIKQAYDPEESGDGYRVYVDRQHNNAVALRQTLES